MLAIASSSPAAEGAGARRGAEEDAGDFTGARREAIERTAEELETSLGVLKSGLWSIDSGPGDGSAMMVDMARDAASRIGSRLKELVALSGMEEPDETGALDVVDLADLVEDTTRGMIADFEKRGVAVSIEDLSGGRSLRTDPERLRIALRSVLEDALSRLCPGGTVNIAWRASEAGPAAHGGPEGVPCGPWMVLEVRSEAAVTDTDGIDAVLESIAAADPGYAGGMLQSCLVLPKHIVRSLGGLWTELGGGREGISIWLPLGY
jgi:hypothetical protein